MRAAEQGDLVGLRAAVLASEKRGDLDNGDAASLAKTVATREIAKAAGSKDACARIKDAEACAEELDGALADRMGTRDDAGAAAALARVETGELSLGDARRYAGDASGAWRAVGARGLVRDEDRSARTLLLRDPDARVRRQAARAARDAGDGADAAALAEMARVDPDPLVRTEAVRAIAALPSDGLTATRLRDLWTAGDDELREDIAMAFAAPSIFDAGGRDALRTILASGKDAPGVVEAAAAVEMSVVTDSPRAPADRALEDEANAVLLDAITEGSRRARLHAIAVARFAGDEPTRAAIQEAAADDGDPEVQVAALARLLEVDDAHVRAAAQTALERLAHAGADDAPNGADDDQAGGPRSEVASRARFALASAGDMRALPFIQADLASKDPYEKLGAASALSALGRSAEAAPLLADADAMVRTRTACTLLMAVRTHK